MNHARKLFTELGSREQAQRRQSPSQRPGDASQRKTEPARSFDRAIE
jgi:hypothetical protein